MEKRILRHVDSVLSSQLTIARGVTYLFVIEEKGEGKDKRKETRRVTDPLEIQAYIDSLADEELATQMADSGNFYFITTERPDNKAIDSMFDRVFGKAVTNVEIKNVEQFDDGIRSLPDDELERELASTEGTAAAVAERAATPERIN